MRGRQRARKLNRTDSRRNSARPFLARAYL